METIIKLDSREGSVIPNNDLIITESKSSQCRKKVRWDIFANITKAQALVNQIKYIISKSGFMKSMSIKKIARGRLHH